MKKLFIIASILIITILSLTTYFLYQKHVAEREIDAYVTDYGIPLKAIESVDFHFSFKMGPAFSKLITMKDDPDNLYVFIYELQSKTVTFYGDVYGNGIGFDSPLLSELKYQPSEKVKKIEQSESSTN